MKVMCLQNTNSLGKQTNQLSNKMRVLLRALTSTQKLEEILNGNSNVHRAHSQI